MKFADIIIEIEIEKGTIEKRKDHLGKDWNREFHCRYGCFPGIIGADNEDLDCYLANDPNEHGDIYIIHQLTPDRSSYDEDKVMLGFNLRSEATAMWGKHKFEPHFQFGGVSVFSPSQFKDIINNLDNSGLNIIANQDEFNALKEGKFLGEVAYQGAFSGHNTYVGF